MGLTFVDLDQYIESRYLKSVQQLFTEKGEAGFREIEQKMLREVATFEDVIISSGGGTPCFFDNMKLMKQAGKTVYIQCDPEELAERLLASKTVRPIIAGKSREELIPFIEEHLAEREPFYRQADIIVTTDKLITKNHVKILADQILDKLKTLEK
jgi:shikimate kinase